MNDADPSTPGFDYGGGQHDLAFWESQGIPNTDIFDPTTGQLKGRWKRTGSGYEQEATDPENYSPAAGGTFKPQAPAPATNTGGGGNPQAPANLQPGSTSSNPAANSQLNQYMSQLMAQQQAAAAERAAASAQQREFSSKVHSNILSRYAEASKPVDENDPFISHQRQVHDAESQRALGMGREAMAARGATQGTPQGASDAYLQSSYENLGKDNAGYAAGLTAQEYDKRRQEIDSLLTLGAGVLSGDETRMLQEEMGTIDAQLKSLAGQNAYSLGTGQLGLGQQGLNNQNQQFYDQMGNSNGIQEALMNQYFMSQLMGSGG